MAGNTFAGVRVGVLALQGDVREHESALLRLGADVIRVRRPEELATIRGLVLPGGESSVIDKLSRTFGLRDPIRRAIDAGMPMFGTCAGLILLANNVVDASPGQQTFGGIDITVRRNAFGRQTESFHTDIAVPALGEPVVTGTFIRAPIVESTGSRVRILGTLESGAVVAVEQGALLGTSFHPEMNDEQRFHRRFLERVRIAAHG